MKNRSRLAMLLIIAFMLSSMVTLAGDCYFLSYSEGYVAYCISTYTEPCARADGGGLGAGLTCCQCTCANEEGMFIGQAEGCLWWPECSNWGPGSMAQEFCLH